jgi:hypothetical protein
MAGATWVVVLHRSFDLSLPGAECYSDEVSDEVSDLIRTTDTTIALSNMQLTQTHRRSCPLWRSTARSCRISQHTSTQVCTLCISLDVPVKITFPGIKLI